MIEAVAWPSGRRKCSLVVIVKPGSLSSKSKMDLGRFFLSSSTNSTMGVLDDAGSAFEVGVRPGSVGKGKLGRSRALDGMRAAMRLTD